MIVPDGLKLRFRTERNIMFLKRLLETEAGKEKNKTNVSRIMKLVGRKWNKTLPRLIPAIISYPEDIILRK